MAIPLAGQNYNSFLTEETDFMMYKQHEIVQSVERKSAKVNVKDHSEKKQSAEQSLENELLQHPFLDIQKFDGIYEPDNVPSPVDNPEAADKYYQLQYQKQLELQRRLEEEHTFNPRFTPPGG